MKRFGSLRGSKKPKDQNRSTQRRQSEPHGLFGRTLPFPCFSEGLTQVGALGSVWRVCAPSRALAPASCSLSLLGVTVGLELECDSLPRVLLWAAQRHCFQVAVFFWLYLDE